MKDFATRMCFGLCLILLAGCSSDVSITESKVTLTTGDFDVKFSKLEPLDATFMIFGGTAVSHKNAISKVALAGLHLVAAQPIYASYPDFHKCASPGAAEAQALIQQLDLVPANSSVLSNLNEVLEAHEASVKEGGDRVCARIEGALLQIESVQARQGGPDMADRFQQFDYYLVTDVKKVEGKQALESR